MVGKFWFLFVVQLLIWVQTANGIKPLGSKVPDECSVSSNSCPSHYLCIRSPHDRSMGTCHCYRYFGFYGAKCRKLSAASYVLITCNFILIITGCIAFSQNVWLIYKLYKRRKLTTNIRTNLILNTMSTLSPIALAFGEFFIVIEVDKDMFWMNHMWVYYFAYTIVVFFLSCMGISICWIETLERVNHRRNKHFKYKAMMYCFAVFYVILIIAAHTIFDSMPIVGGIGNIIIGYSYQSSGKFVARSLRRSHFNRVADERSGGSDSGGGGGSDSGGGGGEIPTRRVIDPSFVLNLADTIEKMAFIMARYAALMTFFFVLSAFTLNTATPIYPQQNSLPRWSQGQISKLLVLSYSSSYSTSSFFFSLH
jgi:hypothetical protein